MSDEARLQDALYAYLHDPKAQGSLQRAAYLYNVPEATLRHRYHGRASAGTGHAPQRLLSPAQIQVVKDMIIRKDTWGFAVNAAYLWEVVMSLVNKEPGLNWTTRFIASEPDICSIFHKSRDKQRQFATNYGIFKSFFTLFEEGCADWNLLPHNIYNFDEKGVLLGIAAASKVIRHTDNKRGGRGTGQDGNRELVTILDCVSAAGVALPPLIIYKGAALYMGWMNGIEATSAAYFAHSATGYTNDKLTYEWLVKVFHLHTMVRAGHHYRLLIMDNHHSHVNHQFLKFCYDHGIVALCLPPHTTHALQPLDVGIFGPLSTYYKQEVQRIYNVSMGRVSIGKESFYSIFKAARCKAYTPRTIQTAFRTTGLIPFNPYKVYRQFNLKPKELTPPPREEVQAPHTPKTPRTLRRYTRDILQNTPNTPAAASNALKHFSHAAETAMAQRDIIQVELDNLRSLLSIKRKTDRRKLQVNALLIDNIEAINAVQAREQQAARNHAKQPQRRGRGGRGHGGRGQGGRQSQQRVGRSQKRKRRPEASSSEEDNLQDMQEEEEAGEEEAGEEEGDKEEAFQANNDSDTSSVRSVIMVRRA